MDSEDSPHASIVRQQIADALGGARAGIARVEIILQSLEKDASFLHVQAFRRHDWLQKVVR